MRSEEPDSTHGRILKDVLITTRAIERALAPLDIDALEEALAARADALRQLGAEAAGADGYSGNPGLSSLAEDVLASDVRARAAASRVMEDLRRQVRELATAHRGLSGYRASAVNVPRFADRKG